MQHTSEELSVGGHSGIEISLFSGPFRRDGMTLNVQITRATGDHAPWTLTVTTPEGASRSWVATEQPFRSDRDAYSALLLVLEEYGAEGLLPGARSVDA